MNITLPRTGSVDLQFEAPPSKSFTHRALVAGALASGKTTVINPLESEDTLLTLAALRKLGCRAVEETGRIVLHGCDGELPAAGPVRPSSSPIPAPASASWHPSPCSAATR